VFTLTADVSSSNQAQQVLSGTVVFTDVYNGITQVLGSGQVQSPQFGSNKGIPGTAVLHQQIGGIGTHSIVAKYFGTAATSQSSSPSQTVTITPTYGSATTLMTSGTSGSITFSSTLSAYGSDLPTGNLNFVDTTSQAQLGSVALDPIKLATQFTPLISNPVANNTPGNGGAGAPAVGDFNNDGYQDFVVPTSADTIEIFLGNGDGTYKPPVSRPLIGASSVVVGDFNKDGNLDAAVISTNPMIGLAVFLGRGDGTFSNPTYSGVNFSLQTDFRVLATGDFNRDGNLDVAATSVSTNSVVIFLGQVDGTFLQQSTTYPTGPTAKTPFNLAVADLDGDQFQDLIVSSDSDANVAILYGKGDGTFESALFIPVPGAVQVGSVTVGDLNGDKIPDIAVTDQFTTTGSTQGAVFVLLGQGSRKFTPAVKYPVAGGPYLLTLADFNRDGKLDIVSANKPGANVGILLGNGDGTFQTPTYYPAGGPAFFATVGDLNGDNQIDIAAVTSNSLGILLAGKSETLQSGPITVHGCGPQSVIATYTGDPNYATSSSTPIVFSSPSPITPTLTEAVQPASPAYGQQVAITATLSPAAYGSTSTDGVPITFTDGGTRLGTAPLRSGVATLNVTSLGIGNHSLNASYPGDGCTFGAAAITSAVTVTKVPVVVTAATSTNASIAGDTVTLTAAVQYTSNATATGSVMFLSNGVGIGTVALVNGTAALQTTSLPGGVDNITAIYSGDAIFAAGTSTNPASVTVKGLDFSIETTSPSPVNGNYGDTPHFTFRLTPTVRPSFPGAVQLSATTLSQLHAAFTFYPSSLAASAGPTTVTLSTTTSLAQTDGPTGPFRRLAPVALCLLLPLLGLRRLRSSRHRLSRLMTGVLLAMLSLGGAASLSGCGSGIAPHDYPIVVTATSGAVTHAVTVIFHVGAVK